MNKKGFTLIELLAVIIILGILMIIAIPSVTKYINDSRKSSYIDTAKELVSGARNLVNEGKLEMYATDTTYYIPSSCIKVENGDEAESPYGKFLSAYIGVIYNGQGYKYYWISVDDSGQGIENLTPLDKLETDLIESDLKKSDVEDVVTTTGIGQRSEIKILNCSNNLWDRQIHLTDTNNNVSEEDGGKPNNQPTAVSTILSNPDSANQFNRIGTTDIYIYKGGTSSSPSNYVRFNNETWRIIGLYGNQMKIKRVQMMSRTYNGSTTDGNVWSTSALKNYLNTTYYNDSLTDTTSRNMIDSNANWYVGGANITDSAYTSYTKAINRTWKGIDTSDPGIGIVSAYEFLYASKDASCLSISGNDYRSLCGTKQNNWLNTGESSWSINSYSELSYDMVSLYRDGYIDFTDVNNSLFFAPAVILKSNVKIISGDGTSPENAYVLQLK